MNEQIKEYIDKYPNDIIDMYIVLSKLIFDSVSSEPQETMWAKLPTYYVGESFVRLIPFQNTKRSLGLYTAIHSQKCSVYGFKVRNHFLMNRG